LKRYISPGSDQIPAELIQAGGSKFHELINSIWNTEKLPHQWKESIIVPVHKKGDITTINFVQNCMEYSSLKANMMRLLGINSVGVDITDQILIRPFAHPYGCETWSLTLREEHRLRVFQNRVLRRIFGPKRRLNSGNACYYSVQNLLVFSSAF
jgi:hypothetical protein